ncbi:hypothetical protein MKW94_025983 [Papaver nudicaule]|uniref:S-protein homolog n=1 Tax=Papaver nudicaule TaxID=74823 RepID=A0AA41VM99_PAPNU|nr:hypothetical protein [Papaver nudicaule]
MSNVSVLTLVNGGSFFNTITVFVQNDLEHDQPLFIHCRSVDDDLGEHKISHRKDFHWSFRNHILFQTKFWCSMQWKDNTGKRVLGSFDIYRSRRDWTLCRDHCYWSIRESGWYLFHKDGKGLRFMYQWPP